MKTALAFDVYGTLIDTAGVTSKLREMVGDDASAFAQLWRDKQLEYSFRHALMRRYEHFSVCVEESLDYTAAAMSAPLSLEERGQLLRAFTVLPRFDDVDGCLEEFDAAEFELFALSNGSREAVETLLQSSGIADHFADIVSVEEVRTFKPDPAVYLHFLERARVAAENAWLISGNPFDVIGALATGMRSAWVRRSESAVFDPWGIEPTITVPGLYGLKDTIVAASSNRRTVS